MGRVWREPVPEEDILWALAERFGWTLEYIQALPEIRIRQFFEVERGRGMAKSSIVK